MSIKSSKSPLGYLVLSLFLIFFSHINSSLAKSLLKFQQISQAQGLASTAVYTTIEDKYGFIWFGTESGLQRFDGNEFKTYQHDPSNQNSLSHNYVRCLLTDNAGNIWAGTENGLDIYDQELARFKRFEFKVSKTDQINARRIRSLYKDSNGVIWIGSYLGLTRFDPISDIQETFKLPKIRSIQSFDNNTMVVGTLELGVWFFDIQKKNFTRVSFSDKSQDTNYENSTVTHIYPNGENELLVSTWGHGIFKLNISTKTLSTFDIGLKTNLVREIIQESENKYWIATDIGLVVYDSQSGLKSVITNLVSYESNETTTIRSIYKTKRNKFWLSTYGNGALLFEPKTKQFEFYSTHRDPSEGLIVKNIYSILEVSNGDIYLGTDRGIVSRFNPKTLNFEHLTFTLNGVPLDTQIFNMYEMSEKEILISTSDRTFRIDTTKIVQELNETKQFEFLNGFELMKGNYVRRRNILMTYNQRQVKNLKLNEAGFFEITSTLNLNLEGRQGYFYQDNDGHTLLTDNFGALYSIDTAHSSSHSIKLLRKQDNLFVSGVFKDKEGDIWLPAISAGLYKLYLEHESDSYSESIYLPRTNIRSALYHENTGTIWASTDNGLYRLNIDSNEVAKFDSSDGLQSNEFLESGIISLDGKIYLGGVNGLSVFSPSKVSSLSERYSVAITNFYIDGVEIQPSKLSESILKKPIHLVDEVSLKHNQNSFAFTFSSLHPFSQNKIIYEYQLEGYEESAHSVDNTKRYANYTNIPPGNYVFHVKSIYNNEFYGTHTAKISITISPPFWRTHFAYLLYLIFMVLIISSFITYRTKRLTQRSKELESQVAERTKEVQQLLAQKNEEFANVSHEFRTPLSLILGPTAQLLKENQNNNTQSRLNIIQRNGYRLLRMVDQLLNLETFRVKSITQKTPQAFGESIKLIAEAFADIAKEKAINFSIGQIDSVYFEFTPDALEKIVLNLLSNAIKYTPENGSINIEAKRTHENHYVITVTDSGIGIAKEQHDKIFERFNRVIDEHSEQITGAGIGLALVKSLVEAHQGSIQLNSKLGQGTEIKINLPIINEVDKEQVSTHHSDEIIALELMSLSAQRHMVDGSQDSQQDTNNQSTVLIIEDNTDMRNYIADSIRSEYHVITAKNGKEGVDIALREVPDLIISDIMMPLMDGYQVAHSLRENDITNHIPIVLLTARGDKKSRLKGWQEKADEYLTKPFDDEELKIRLANLLAIRNILKKRFGEVVFTEQPSTTDSEEDDLEKLKSDQQQAFLQKLNQVIDQVYADPKIAIIDIAKSLAMSDRQLSRKLKSITDLTPVEYLRRYRLEQGKILLRQGRPSTIVAHDVGFSSQSYFGKCFKAQFGVSPSEFLKK